MTSERNAEATPKLTAIEAHATPKMLLLTEDVYLIGRWEQCQIIVDDERVSRLHAKIERQGPRYMLSDMGSVNKTWVNGKKIETPHSLTHGDEIGLAGPATFLVFEDPKATKDVANRLMYDPATAMFSINANPIALAPSQFHLLLHLYSHSGQLCTRESCVQAVYKRAYQPDVDDDALNRVVANLRKRLHEAAPDIDFFQARHGMGYQFNV